MQDECKACFPKTQSLLLAPPHSLWMGQRLAVVLLPVSLCILGLRPSECTALLTQG